ncbi:hypothetical protein [Pseudomonas fontis]|uniref:Uncharacterized protein n=1 Tax=Pseudomonas fontis TaxID=2942633 RepID=A0ABT5NV45_9PSED|nr:hypothetical protein [Pseudomonas fontis]MDD0973845.1 hypothetical protein [Pseudomonas fontis]MDD0992017.1 hypothetical protein [Pseudomonas fontis]
MPDLEPWQSLALGVGGLLGTIATAIATFFLWRVTLVLARETTRMAEASAQPHVVANFRPNRWSARHFDLQIENTGNATAYDIKVAFNPPLQNGEARRSDAKIPFESVSVLKPGQGMSSYLSDYEPLKGKVYTVSITWLKSSASSEREKNTYTLSMADHEGTSWLGGDPALDTVKHLKSMTESLKAISQGRKHLQVDVYTALDRLRERRALVRSLRTARPTGSQEMEAVVVEPEATDVEDTGRA